jgi:hypothetical protein
MHYKIGKIYESKLFGSRFLLVGRKECSNRHDGCSLKCEGTLVGVGDISISGCGYVGKAGGHEPIYKEVKTKT